MDKKDWTPDMYNLEEIIIEDILNFDEPLTFGQLKKILEEAYRSLMETCS